MTERIRKYLFFAVSLIFVISFVLGYQLNTMLEGPELCSSCHEMQPYYSSYLNPQNGSIIASHKLTCVQCHANKSIYDAKKEIATEILVYKLNLQGPSIPKSQLKPDCTKCHSLTSASMHQSIINITNCTYCHWAHRPAEGWKTNNLLPSIPFGPHRNQTCIKCHGTNFQIPRCINCHTGHGGQKLENSQCLVCHTNPHVPKKPGILPQNTVKFTGDLPFSVCQPCHENEYFNITNTLSRHTEMSTCTRCHSYHGEKPACSKCHPGMNANRHKDFKCETCHLKGVAKVTCQDCHGRSHEWSAMTAVLNPK